MTAPMIAGVYPPLALASLAGPRRASAAFPFSESGLALTHLGRGAVWLALRSLGLGSGKRIAMPAYHCGSEVEAARLAGLEIHFYRVDAALRVDLDDLARVASSCDAAYLISHFGFPLPPSPPDVIAIEDVAHGLFSADAAGPLGSRGTAAVFCPRKSLGVPDGGAVLVREGIDPVPSGRPSAKAMARSTASLTLSRTALVRPAPVRRSAVALLTRASRTDRAVRSGELTETVIGEWDLEPADMEAAASKPSRLTERIVTRVDPGELAEIRRRNYGLLLDELGEQAPPAYRKLELGVVPLYFPLMVADRPCVIARLLEGGVRALEIWPVPHPLLDRERFAELEPARRGLVALPVHQTLRPAHMRGVVEAAKGALAGG